MITRLQSVISRYYYLVIVLLVIYALAVNQKLSELCAGVAILLFGMLFLSDGFKVFSGGFLERVLTRSTQTPFKSVIFGTLATAIMQSSSLVSVLAISFVSASLINLTQGIGVMFGANLGNTAGSWLIAGASKVDISSLALPIIVGGLLLNLHSKKTYKGLGKVFAGLGFFFLGVFYIKDGFSNFGEILDLSQYEFEGYKAVVAFLFIGAAITAIIQSSHATLAIIIAAYSAGQIGYDSALAAVLGTSVGGVVTALVASLSATIEGKRLAIANCIFNFTTVTLVAVLFPVFKFANDFLAELFHIGTDSILRLSLFHTLFNVFGVGLLIATIPAMARFLSTKMTKAAAKNESQPLFINDALLNFHETAVQALSNEVKHLYDNASAIITHTIGFHRTDIASDVELETAVRNHYWLTKDLDVDELYRKKIKTLFNAIMEFSTKLQITANDDKHANRIVGLQIASRKIAEATKNIALLQANMRKYATGKNEHLKKEYDDMRIDLAKLLRVIEQVKSSSKKGYKNVRDVLKKQKKFFEREDRDVFLVVEHLIQKGYITTSNGTSLLNDTSFINNVAKELISATNHIYGLIKTTNVGDKKADKKDKKKKKKGKKKKEKFEADLAQSAEILG